MHPIAACAWRTIQRHGLIQPDTRVIAAVSGGSDSVSLVLLLAELQAAGGFTLAALAHFNHQLRGSESDADEAFCCDLASEVGVPWVRGGADVAALAKERGLSIEDAGRRARYTFLNDVARDSGAQRIAVGHTLNDQAETFLLRLIRGAGPRGLAGIHPRAGTVVRPLLEIGREDLRAYLSAQGRTFREDASNRDVAVPRNRVRHELLPLLQRRFSPGIIEVLARETAIARDDASYLDGVAAEAADRLARYEGAQCVIDAAALSAIPPAIATRVIQTTLARIAPDRFVGYDHLERVLILAASEQDGRLDLPGAAAERSGARLVLRSRARTRQEPQPPAGNPFRYSLSIPGEAFCHEAACVIAARAEGSPAAAAREGLKGRGGAAVIDASSLTGDLAIRNRRAGDAFRPLGLGGRKKLQDFFVDRKIARAARDRIPLVVDSHDRIVWVAGHALSDEFRVTARTGAVVILTLRELGGRA